MDLSAYLTILRRWSVTLIAAALVAGAVAYLVASRVPPTYAAEAQVLVGPINTDENTLGASSELVQTYAQLITTDRVLADAISALELDITPTLLREATTTVADSVTRILTIQTLAGDPETAAAIAGALIDSLSDLTGGDQVRPEGEISIITPPQPYPEPVQPQIPLIVLLAAAAGFVAALGIVLLTDYVSNTVSGPGDLRKLTDSPFLAAIPRGSRRSRASRKKPLAVESDPDSRQALAYRLLASKVSASDPTRALRTLLVLGVDGHEGSAEVAANVGAILSRSGRRVRLVDADDEDRELTRIFGLTPSHGLGELAHDASLLHKMTVRVAPGMDVVPHLPGRDPRIMDHDRATIVLERLAADVDLVILTTAPIQRSSSALLWARAANAAILVARRDKTKRESATFSVEALRMLEVRLLGTVLHGGRGEVPAAKSTEATTPPAASRELAGSTTAADVPSRNRGRSGK